MKKIIQKISAALQVVLLAPIKLPGKALNFIKYIALGLGVVETVLDDKDEQSKQVTDPSHSPPSNAGVKSEQGHHILSETLGPNPQGKDCSNEMLSQPDNRVVLAESIDKEKEVPDEIE